jgi:hypothetical protein
LRGVRGIAVAAVAVALLVAGCGGGKSGKIVAPEQTQRKGSILGGAASAGVVEGYEPTGEIIADNGFRPWVDGFGFENYGNDAGPENMTPDNMVDLFGPRVCENGDPDNCELTPTAAKWMEVENERMAGGHCMGFSVTANQFYDELRDPTEYGGEPTAKIPVQGNVDLQSLIAQNWTFQDLPAVQEEAVTGAPTDILETLNDSLNDEQGELYTIGIFKRDGTAGHAVTPFALEENGDDVFHILVYDNNFPGIIRAIEVDANEDTWSYVGGPDPSNTDQLYEGDADTESMLLFPTSPGDETQPCPFCAGETVGQGGSAGSLGSAKQYDQITLDGDPLNHAHLVLRDDEGRVTGFVGGKIVNNIPGVIVQRTLAAQNWRGAPEPTYLVPKGLDISATLDGSALEKPDKETITLIGQGLYAEVDDIVVEPDSKNVIEFQGGETGIIFHTDPRHDQTPILTSVIQE